MDAEAMLTGSRLLDVLVVSAVRFLRESLAEILGQVPGLRICGQASGVEEALAGLAARPDVVLLDVGIPGGVAAAARLRDAAQGARIIALGVGETAENVLAWAEAGVAGYVPDTASVAELVSLIRQISEGEQPCPSGIVARLLLRIGLAGAAGAGGGADSDGAGDGDLPADRRGAEQQGYRAAVEHQFRDDEDACA